MATLIITLFDDEISFILFFKRLGDKVALVLNSPWIRPLVNVMRN